MWREGGRKEDGDVRCRRRDREEEEKEEEEEEEEEREGQERGTDEVRER